MRSGFLPVVFLSLLCVSIYPQQGLAAAPTGQPHLVVEAVECHGNAATSCDYIRRKLHLSANSAVDDDAVQSAELRLSALPDFKSVHVRLEKGSEKGKALLIVEVVEAGSIVTEFALGAEYSSTILPAPFSDTPDILQESVVGRVSNQNLLGSHKIAELAVSGFHAADSQRGFDGLSATLNYIDPNAFDSERAFWSMSSSYARSAGHADATVTNVTTRNDATNRSINIGLSVGYRLFEYSYLLLGFDYQKQHYQNTYQVQAPLENYNQVVEIDNHSSQWRLGYGWDSEDDAYFATRGARFSATVSHVSDTVCTDCAQLNWRVAYKQTWMMGKSAVWTANIGGEPEAVSDRLRPVPVVNDTNRGGLSLTYAHLLSSAHAFGGARRGRWYLQLGTGPVELYRGGRIGGYPDQAHVTLGIRFESKVLGIVDLYAAGSRNWVRPTIGSGQ